MLRTVIAAGALTLASLAPVLSQDMLDGTAVDQLAELAAAYGEVAPGTATNGDPMIDVTTERVAYRIFFHTCAQEATCRDIRFYAVFIGNKPPLDRLNEWNREKRWGKAYADADLDAVLEWDVNLSGGVSRATMAESFSIWNRNLEEFQSFIGAGAP